jgi:hypothetical protein
MLQRVELLDARVGHHPLNHHPRVGAGQKLGYQLSLPDWRVLPACFHDL